MEPQNINISLSDTEPIKCEQCGHEYFIQSFMLRKISRLVAGSESDAIMPIQVFECSNCGFVNKEFLPNQ